MQKIFNIYNKLLCVLNALANPMALIIRLWMAKIFWASGILKINDWSNTIYLFTNEHPVPFLPPLLAAISATTFELLCPVLLTVGFATRLATLPMLAMTAVINFTYDNSPEHYYWAILLGTILFYGPGKLSLDYFISKKFSDK
jgi:putative oxidoreductase